jgi:uncharacterized protein
MKLDVERQAPGRVSLEMAEDLPLHLAGEAEPAQVHLEGILTVDNLESRLVLMGTLQGRGRVVCDRCLADFELTFQVPVQLLVLRDTEVTEDEGETYIIHQRQGEVDLTPPLYEAVILALPVKRLCREDCRGLCPTCGANLNGEVCRCTAGAADSRWEGLPEA